MTNRGTKTAEPTQRELIHWEQEDAIYDIMRKAGQWLTINQIIEAKPVARCVADQKGPARPMGRNAITRAVNHMHYHKIIDAQAATKSGKCVISNTLEYRVRESS